ncbi:MAG: flagellar export protein FliJ [Desulfobacterales bacterium]
MKPYSFRLDKILDYRSYLRKKAQIDVFNARNECLKREKEVLNLVEKRVEISNKCSEEESIGMSVPVYHAYQAYLQRIKCDLEKAKIKLNEEKEEVIAKEMVLKQASINKKTLEVLKELKHKKYMEALGREEQKTLDEIVITGKGRST